MPDSIKDRLTILVVLAVVAICLSLVSPHFLTVNNIINVLLQVAITTIIGVGMTFVILTGGIDLSVGSIVALSVVTMAVVHKAVAEHELGAFTLVVAILMPAALALITGALVGLLNGVVIARYGVPAFIMTLGMMSMARGAAYIVSKNETMSVFPDELTFLGNGRVLGIPVLVVTSLAMVALSAWVLNRTKFGRYVYALGGNRTALRLSGVNTVAVEMAVYGISGLTCGIGAIALLGRLNVAQPVAGFGYELDAIGAVIIGGTSIFGGEGRVTNTLLGALLVGLIRNGLNLLNVSPNVQLLAIGAIIVGAVFYDKVRNASK